MASFRTIRDDFSWEVILMRSSAFGYHGHGGIVWGVVPIF